MRPPSVTSKEAVNSLLAAMVVVSHEIGGGGNDDNIIDIVDLNNVNSVCEFLRWYRLLLRFGGDGGIESEDGGDENELVSEAADGGAATAIGGGGGGGGGGTGEVDIGTTVSSSAASARSGPTFFEEGSDFGSAKENG